MPAIAEKTVYTSTSHEPGERISYPVGLGVRCRQTSLGGRYRMELGWGNQWRLLMNDRLPVDRTGQLVAHPQDGVCSKCGYIYSHLMRNAGQPCDECRTEALAQLRPPHPPGRTQALAVRASTRLPLRGSANVPCHHSPMGRALRRPTARNGLLCAPMPGALAGHIAGGRAAPLFARG